MDQTTHNLPAPPRADGMASLKARRADNMDLMPHAPSVSLRRPLHTSRPHVVIVGGGFGGLYTARGLARTPVAVTVVDQHNYHVFRPMLYQVATGLLSADEIAAPIRSVLWKQKNTEVLMAEVIGVDTQHHLVQSQESDLPYDYLILATGAHYNYFARPSERPVPAALDQRRMAACDRYPVASHGGGD